MLLLRLHTHTYTHTHTHIHTHTYTHTHIHTHMACQGFFHCIGSIHGHTRRRSATGAAADELRLLLIKTVLKCGRSFNYGQCPIEVTDPNVLNVSANL